MIKNLSCFRCGKRLPDTKYFSRYFCRECGEQIKKESRGVLLLVLGVILMLTGGGLWIYGDKMNHDVDTVLRSVLESGETEPGSVFITIGIILIIIGAVMVISGVIIRVKNIPKAL